MEFVTPTAVELSHWIGDGGCFHSIASNAFRNGTISFAVKNSAVVSASAAEDITYFMIAAMVSTGPFHLGIGPSSDRKMCAPDVLLDFVSLLKPVSECADNAISLAL